MDNMSTVLLKEIYLTVKKNSKYWDGDSILKYKIIDDLKKYDKELISLLMTSKLIKEKYLVTINDVTMFKLDEFIQFFTYRTYLPNSFTQYSNKIGLTVSNKYLDYNSDVVLDFPYKDTILEGGLNNEEESRDEIYYHKIIAREEIDVLLSPKVLNNISRYSLAGKTKEVTFSDDDNLVIKGNNLLALHSLKERYAGKVKMIYIDPPYNTGNSSFNYNDRFKVATWLTFMKNRLEIAKELLSEDGIIFVQIDTSRSSGQIVGTTMEPYLHVLMDEIFGRNNYIGTLHWKKKRQPSFLSRIAAIMENIIVFAKDEKNVDMLSIESTSDSTKRVDNASNPISKMKINKGILYRGKESNTIIKKGVYKNKTMETEFLDDVLIENHRVQNDFNVKANFRTTQSEITRFCNEDLLYITSSNSFRRFASEKEKNNPKSMTDLLLDWGQNQDGTEELIDLFGEKVFDTPKPELLLHNLIKSCTNEGDIVLDFFMGSGTTQAVAHKMNRQYIGIEQMDYINEITVPRMIKVIEGEQGGVSKQADWNGGGSFIYMELKDLNQQYVNEISDAVTTTQLKNIYHKLGKDAILKFEVDIDQANFEDLIDENLLKSKNLLIDMLEQNQLYLNYSEIEDCSYNIGKSDIEFNHQFYKKGGNQ